MKLFMIIYLFVDYRNNFNYKVQFRVTQLSDKNDNKLKYKIQKNKIKPETSCEGKI